MNNRVDQLDPGSAGSATYWTEYVDKWTAWNHLRTVASLGAALLLTIALQA